MMPGIVAASISEQSGEDLTLHTLQKPTFVQVNIAALFGAKMKSWFYKNTVSGISTVYR